MKNWSKEQKVQKVAKATIEVINGLADSEFSLDFGRKIVVGLIDNGIYMACIIWEAMFGGWPDDDIKSAMMALLNEEFDS